MHKSRPATSNSRLWPYFLIGLCILLCPIGLLTAYLIWQHDNLSPSISVSLSEEPSVEEVHGIWQYFPRARGECYLLLAPGGEAFQIIIRDDKVNLSRSTTWSVIKGVDQYLVALQIEYYRDPYTGRDEDATALIFFREVDDLELFMRPSQGPEENEYRRLPAMPPDLKDILKDAKKDLPEGFFESMERANDESTQGDEIAAPPAS